MTKATNKLQRIREAAEADLYTFAKLVNPLRLYGEIHKEVFDWLSSENEDINQLLLLPRAHMKSHCIAVWCAWWVTKNPETTILYISATSTLAEDQLYAIKGIFASDVYKKYWPDMFEKEEGKREKWSQSAISVDHPTRKLEGVRDATIRTAGLTTNTTGWHADVVVADDVVVPDNAYTEDGRTKVAAAMSQISSIKNAGGFIKACGTRYHPADQYDKWKKQTMQIFDDETDEIVDEVPIWEIFERVVEKEGVFLWPREVRPDGKRFGYDRRVLARIKGEYEDKTQYFAQYYNDPNDKDSNRFGPDSFQYYDLKHLRYESGKWFFSGKKLNVYAAIDFAYSMSKKADYTAIVVVGVDSEGFIYILDIDRFKTDRVSDYFEHVRALHGKWNFQKLRAEVTAAQSVIVRDLRDEIRKDGLRLSIVDHRPNRYSGSKEERIAAALEPKYDNRSVFHYRGGYTPVLEEELMLARPAHDDIKDALASVVEIAISPSAKKNREKSTNVIQFNSRFGGVAI